VSGDAEGLPWGNTISAKSGKRSAVQVLLPVEMVIVIDKEAK